MWPANRTRREGVRGKVLIQCRNRNIICKSVSSFSQILFNFDCWFFVQFERCVTCNIDFPTPTALYRHSKQKHEAAEFKCKLNKCVESYATPEELETHHRTQHEKTQCKKCKRSILVSQFEHHMRVQHPPGDPVICDMCGKAFVNLFLYKAHHRSLHENEAIIRLQCDICKQS